MKLSLIITAVAILNGLYAAPPDFNFSFNGYTPVSRLLIKSCDPDVEKQINQALMNNPSKPAVEKPSVNSDKKHVTCKSDPVMGKVAQFTIYKNDNDAETNDKTKQRIEMKVSNESPASLRATPNTNYIYTWWFQLNKDLIVSSEFFHIFQLKAVGRVSTNPVFTFTITRENGLHMRVNRNESRDLESRKDYLDLLQLSTVLGNWIQARVEVSYKKSKDGYVSVTLKSQDGKQLYPKSGSDRVSFQTFWPGASFVRPKWGLYRRISSSFRPFDTQRFQNVQIWKGN